MVKRKIAIWLLLCFCLSFLSCYAQAVSTEEAIEPLQPEKECTLTMGYCCDGIAFENVQVKLYKIAEVQENLYYYLTDLFADTELVLNGIRTTGEWNVVRYTLEAFILAHNVPADRTAMTDANGQAKFSVMEADYKVSFLSLPAGYTYSGDAQEFYFEEGFELTITLKAAG